MEVYRQKTDELYHHGVKGQRWGVRRYQNEDGSLTTAGRQRYSIDNNGTLSSEGQRNLFKDTKRDKRKEESIQKDINRADGQLYVQTLGKTGEKIKNKQINAWQDKKYKISKKRQGRIREALKNNISEEEKKSFEKLIKEREKIMDAMDNCPLEDTKKWDKLVLQNNDNNKKLNKMYEIVGERVAGKYLNKKISGSKFWGTQYTMKDAISSELWNQTVDELIKKDEW